MKTLVRLAEALEIPIHKLLEVQTDSKWLDEGRSVLEALSGLSEHDAMFALRLFRMTVEHLKEQTPLTECGWHPRFRLQLAGCWSF